MVVPEPEPHISLRIDRNSVNDTNSYIDLFVRKLKTGTTGLVSVNKIAPIYSMHSFRGTTKALQPSPRVSIVRTDSCSGYSTLRCRDVVGMLLASPVSSH